MLENEPQRVLNKSTHGIAGLQCLLVLHANDGCMGFHFYVHSRFG